jgi:DNA-directed RNA polymerase subunit RPC12/RpoP
MIGEMKCGKCGICYVQNIKEDSHARCPECASKRAIFLRPHTEVSFDQINPVTLKKFADKLEAKCGK